MAGAPFKTRVAFQVSACGGDIEAAAKALGISAKRIRDLLNDPEFLKILNGYTLEPLLAVTSAVMRWAPVSIARLIEDLQGESEESARGAAREILKLALDAQQNIIKSSSVKTAVSESGSSRKSDPLTVAVGNLSDDRLLELLKSINYKDKPAVLKMPEHQPSRG